MYFFGLESNLNYLDIETDLHFSTDHLLLCPDHRHNQQSFAECTNLSIKCEGYGVYNMLTLSVLQDAGRGLSL